MLKFSDWRWTAGKEATPVADGTRLIALTTAAMWVRWQGGKPAEYRVRQPGQRLPEREELGHDNEGEWEIGPSGQPVDPWQNTPWIPERSATRLREADLNVLSKLGKQGLEWRLEPEAFTGREVGREDDLLDFLVGCPVDIEVARQPST